MNENNSLKALTNPGEADDFFKIDNLGSRRRSGICVSASRL